MMSSTPPLILLLAGPFSLRGTSAYTLRLAERLPAEGFRVRIVTPDAKMVSASRRSKLSIAEYPHLLSPVIGCVVRRWMRRP